MALSFVTDKTPVDLLKIPLDRMMRPLRPRFDSMEMDDSLASDQMKVFLRVRPFTDEEKTEEEDQNCYTIENQRTIVARAPASKGIQGVGKVSHKYSFNSIMGPDSKQIDVFNKVVRDPVKGFIEGRNTLVFTYGITSSGKTFTVQGPSCSIGILPRALDIIFNTINMHLHNFGNGALAPQNFDEVVKLNDKDFEVITKQKEELVGLNSSSEVDANAKPGSAFSLGESDGVSIASHDSGESCSSSAFHYTGLAQILAESNNRERDQSKIKTELKTDMRFSIWVSYAEIYNECIYDLLTPVLPSSKSSISKGSSTGSGGYSKSVRRPTLELRMDKHGSIYIRGLRCLPVSTADDAYRLLLVGRQNQQMASTRLNLTSSRSHTIFSIHAVRCSEKAQARFARVSTLRFCDLAGSERTVKTQNVGDRLREAGNINTSLLTLGRCIHILRNNQMNPDRPQLVPYRESKLTRLFQNFFTGKGRACMLVNINQCASMFDETLNVLKFSAIAKQVVVQQAALPTVTLPSGEDEARRSRFKSLGLRTPKPGSKISIAWESTPRHGVATPKSALSTILFTGNDGTLVEEHMENTITSIAEETAIEYDTAELLSIIEDLKQQLIDSKKECISIESKVREDVCKEMDDLVLTLEARHEEALREQETHMQEQSDRRIQLYLSSVCNSNKRARIMNSDELDDGVIIKDHIAEGSLLLRNKMEDLEAELSDLRSQCSVLREALSHVTRERDEQTLAVTRLKFQVGLSDREAAQRTLKDEEKIKQLEIQLQKLMTNSKDDSNFSDIDCLIDNSRIVVVSKKKNADGTTMSSGLESVISHHGKKKNFSPIIPKRGSDEGTEDDQWGQHPSIESGTKPKVFSPIGTCYADEMRFDTESVLSRQTFDVPTNETSFDSPAPTTVIKKDSQPLARENDKLKAQLSRMQKELLDSEAARKVAETNLKEARLDLTNATTGIGSFLRHETEVELEEEIDRKKKDIDALNGRLRGAETTIRDLEQRRMAACDTLSEEQQLRRSLECRHEQLEKVHKEQNNEFLLLKKEKENATQTLQKQKLTLDGLMSQIKSLDSVCKEHQRKIVILDEDRSQLEQKYKVERETVVEHSNRIVQLTATVGYLENEIGNLTKENCDLRIETEKNHQMISDLDAERKRNRILNNTSQEMRAELNNLKRKLKAADEQVMRDSKELMDYSKINKRLVERIKLLESEYMSMKENNESKDVEIRHINEALNQTKSELNSYVSRCNDMKFMCSNYEKEIKCLKEKENQKPEGSVFASKEEIRPVSRTRGQTLGDSLLKSNVTEDGSKKKDTSSRRVTRSMRHK